ncbi:MAG: dTMP kinase [Chloroflexi bacterium]|nr:dTMP kinase [Chloroflexota bacterium]MCL5075960.1 dTMP kinase [Chloroflexota bacterium]
MFITFEGPEGAGKTTQARLLKRYLSRSGYTVILTQEPGGTALGAKIRRIVTRGNHLPMLPRAEMLLFAASRAQLVEEQIRPHLAQGHIVICDRYADSTLAYQFYGRGLGRDLVEAVIAFATGGLKPDVTILLDLSPEEGLKRKGATPTKGMPPDRFEQEELLFHEHVRHGYLELARKEPQRWLVIDGTLPIFQIQQLIKERIGQEMVKHQGWLVGRSTEGSSLKPKNTGSLKEVGE